MDFYDDWCNETEMTIEIVKKSPIHLKALEKRSTTLAKENEQLKADNLALQKKIDEIQQIAFLDETY